MDGIISAVAQVIQRFGDVVPSIYPCLIAGEGYKGRDRADPLERGQLGGHSMARYCLQTE
jgi:hypothetical protein